MDSLILCLGHFIESGYTNNKDNLCSIKIIKSQLNKNFELKKLLRYVYIMYKLAKYNNPEIYKKMIEDEIHKSLMDIFIFDEDIENRSDINEKDLKKFRLIIIKTIGKMLSLENNAYIKKIIESGICEFLKKLLQYDDLNIIKNIFFCLYNICGGSTGQINYIYDNNTVFLSIEVAKNVYEIIKSTNQFINNKISKEDLYKAFREIVYFFTILIINSFTEILIPVVKYDNNIVIIILLEYLKLIENDNNNKNDEIISNIIKAISKLLDYSKNNGKLKYFVEFLEKKGFKEILEKIQINSSDNNMLDSEIILNEYFDDGNNNSNSINIDDIINNDNNDSNNNNNDDE